MATQETSHDQDAAQSRVREAVDRAGQRLKQGAHAASEQAKERAAEAGEGLRQRGEAYVNQQKSRAADEVSHLSSAVRCAAERLHESDDQTIASYADAAADQIDRACDYVRRQDVRGMMRDAQNFARRRPEIVVGGLFVAGLVVARMLRASDHPPRDESSAAADTYDEYDLDREAQLDADAQSDTVGSHLPRGPEGVPRAFEPGGFSTVTGANPASVSPDAPAGAAPASPQYPNAPEGEMPSGWGSVTP